MPTSALTPNVLKQDDPTFGLAKPRVKSSKLIYAYFSLLTPNVLKQDDPIFGLAKPRVKSRKLI